MLDDKVRILFVEDEAIYVNLIPDFFLGNPSVEVTVATSKEEARSIIANASPSFDIIVLDWWLSHPETYQPETSADLIDYIRNDVKTLAMLVIFTSYDVSEVEPKALGVPVLSKNMKGYLKEKMNEAIRGKSMAVEAIRAIRLQLDKLVKRGSYD